jgi:hypothetical protein
MAKTENPKTRRGHANTAQVNETDVQGQEADVPGLLDRTASIPTEGHPRSEVTGQHDAGSGANETVDGLTSSEEAIRRGAEDVPIGVRERDLEDIPVFDRADALPKV